MTAPMPPGSGSPYTSDEGDEPRSFFVRALYDFSSSDTSSLSFERGALIEVLTQLESGWWDGLLGNDVRGWFPSNYVEPISDAEAEAELRARGMLFDDDDDDELEDDEERNAADELNSQYAGLGIAADYETVRRLVKGDGAVASDSDAFEQLAEAAMIGNVASDVGQTRAARRRSKMQEAAAASAAAAAASSSNDTTPSLRSSSKAKSFGELDTPRTNNFRAGPSERERMRSDSIGTSASTAAQNRPRAATTANSSLAPTQAMAGAAARERSASSQDRGGRKQKRKNESDFWVPKVTLRGEIVYYNTRTGAQSADLPDGQESGDALSGQSALPSEDEGMFSDHSGTSSRRGGGDAASGSRSDAASVNRTRSSSLASGVPVKAARRNAIEAMPDPADVALPWKLRMTNDERAYFYFNVETRETRWKAPHGALLRRSADADSYEELADDVASARTGRGPRADSEDSDTEPPSGARRTPGKSPRRVARKLRPISMPPSFSEAPRTMVQEESEALDLQKTQEPEPAQSISALFEKANLAIAGLAAVAAESVAADGKSEADRRAVQPASALLDSSRLGAATTGVVHAIRDLLYAAGSLGVPQVDLVAISELAFLVEDAPTSAIAAFQAALVALQGPTHAASREQPLVAMASQQALAPTPVLLPLSKKVNAAVSKLVLSARAVVEQPVLEHGRNADVAHAQAEKLNSYRQRVRDDAMDLSRAVSSLAAEIERAKASRTASSLPSNWVRRVQGVLRSGSGTAGIGLELLGGGAAAGWRGSGFVLPTPVEAATLRAEAMGSFQNPFELTKDAQNALASGKVALRRKPTQLLSREFMEKRLKPQNDDLVRLLDELAKLCQPEPNAGASSASGEADEVAGSNNSQMLLSQARFALIRFGTVMALVEDVDIAAVLDVDGPAEDEPDAEARSRLMITVINARLGVHALTGIKQGAYDCSANLLAEVQDASVAASHGRLEQDTAETLLQLTRSLVHLVERQFTMLGDLADIAEHQSGETKGRVGARAKVYGIEDVKISAGPRGSVGSREDGASSRNADLAEDDDEGSEEHEVMYLGPGLAVPNGPPASRTVASPNAPSSKSSASPSMRSALGARTRSTSITTGASVNSQDSARVVGGRRGTNETLDDGKSGKRFFGDDASASASTEAVSTPGLDAPPLPPLPKQIEEVPWFLEPDYAPSDIVMNASGQVKGATLSALMERLTMHNAFNATFNNTFLTTYRSFTTTDAFLEMLFARFRVKMPPGLTADEQAVWTAKKQMPIRLRVFNVLKSWIESHFYEGEDDEYLKRIKSFALDEMGQSVAMETPSKLLIRLVERKQGEGEQIVRKMVMPTSAPAPILPKNLRKIKFLDIDPTEMARQLTLIDSRLYNRIRPVECLAKAWSQPNGLVIAKGIRDVISANNRVSGWVSEAILVQEDLKKRAAWVKHFVAIADRCYALNNFSSMMAIYSGLNNASLNRLRRTWDAVNQRHLALFENMKVVLAPTKNFSSYRQTLRQLNPPCVPFLGVYLTDLTFIEDGNSDHLKTDERLINFSKRQMTAEKIGEIMIYQSTPYNLTPVQGIQKFIEDNMVDSRTDDELFEQSLRLEPREREDEKIARLLQESGFL